MLRVAGFAKILIFLTVLELTGIFLYPVISSPSPKIHKFITAYDFNDSDIPFIANHFDIIDTDLGKSSQVQNIKNLKPSFKAIYYKNALTHREGATEAWYVRDAKTGAKLVNKDWGWYLMDIVNQAYRINLANFIKNNLSNNQVFDGVFLDDVWGSVSSDRFYREGTKETGVIPEFYINSFHNNMIELLKIIKSTIGSKILIINTGDTNKDYLAIGDGQMDEAFCHAKWQAFGEYYPTWQRHLNNMIAGSKSGKIYLAQSGAPYGAAEYEIKKTAKYCFSMFLLGANDNSYFYFSFTKRYQGVTYFPEWDINIGNPVEDYRSKPGTPLYEREYSKGLVLINPSLESVRIDLGSKYRNLEGSIIDFVTLGSHEGEILIKPSEDTTPPAPPKGVKISQ